MALMCSVLVAYLLACLLSYVALQHTWLQRVIT